MRKIIFNLTIISASLLFAVDNNNPLSPQNFKSQNDQEFLKDNSNQDLKIKKFYLDINKDEIKDIQNKDKELKETFDKFDNSIINYKPVLKPISTIEKIMTHPYFTTTILLPAGSVISSVDISKEPITLKYEQNTILLRVKKDFDISNMTVIYTLGGKNFVTNFLIERYDRSKTDENLNLVLNYKNVKRLDDLKVVQTYQLLYKRNPVDKYNYIEINGIVYRIIREDNKIFNDNGYVFIAGKPYRVDTGSEN